MVRISPSVAKNTIRRSLEAIVDPPPTPTQIKELWDYFGDKCAYCGVIIPKSSRTGHLDHLVPKGGNSIFNRALACARCNGDEKREQPWRQFLQGKASDLVSWSERQTRIEVWLARGASEIRSEYDHSAAATIIEQATDAYDSSVTRMRSLRNSNVQTQGVAMRIGCLGWGSLVWNVNGLPIQEPWFTDGPLLPIEFVRFSSGSRVTLVIAEGQPEIRSLWALMTTETLEEAVGALAKREHVKRNIDRDIGRWKIGDPRRDPIVHTISTWAAQHQLAAVVWTALSYKFKKERDRIPSLAEVAARLRQATESGLTEPREYIERAPRQIDTNLRRAINQEFGWTCVSAI